MPDLPGGGFTVLVVCGLGLALVAIFALKELRFKFHYRQGIKRFDEGAYGPALQNLLSAERLWMFRLSKQTTTSRAEDCRNLRKVLELVREAAVHCSIQIETTAYQNAVAEMEQFFSVENKRSLHYPKLHSKVAELRKQFRADSEHIRKCSRQKPRSES